MYCRRFTFLLLSGALLFGLSGCNALRSKGVIRTPGASVYGVPDAGKPAILNTSDAAEVLPLPEGSRIFITETAAVPAKPATLDAPAEKAKPATKLTEIAPAGPTEWRKTEATVNADTGTIDTSVTTHRIDVAERRWLLFTAIGCGILGLVVRSMVPQWPGLSNGLLLGAALAGLSWKLSDIPAWLWAIALGVVALLALGYKRAEWDKDGDGVPDALQRNPK